MCGALLGARVRGRLRVHLSETIELRDRVRHKPQESNGIRSGQDNCTTLRVDRLYIYLTWNGPYYAASRAARATISTSLGLRPFCATSSSATTGIRGASSCLLSSAIQSIGSKKL